MRAIRVLRDSDWEVNVCGLALKPEVPLRAAIAAQLLLYLNRRGIPNGPYHITGPQDKWYLPSPIFAKAWSYLSIRVFHQSESSIHPSHPFI